MGCLQSASTFPYRCFFICAPFVLTFGFLHPALNTFDKARVRQKVAFTDKLTRVVCMSGTLRKDQQDSSYTSRSGWERRLPWSLNDRSGLGQRARQHAGGNFCEYQIELFIAVSPRHPVTLTVGYAGTKSFYNLHYLQCRSRFYNLHLHHIFRLNRLNRG